MRSITRWAFAPLAALALAACNPVDGEAEKTADATAAATPSSEPLSASLPDGLEKVALSSGLNGVLEGVGPYTVLAPMDAVVTRDAAGLDDKANSAQAAALLRAHILPGALTRADIAAALDKEGAGGKVEMRTMSDSVVTFSRDGKAIVVTAPDGAVARLTGEETLASNGVVQPVDALLVKATAPAAAPAG